MSPLVEQMLNATVSNDVETRLLEDLFEQNVECEAQNHGSLKCRGEVSHVFKCCKYSQVICDSRVKFVKDWYLGVTACTGCDEKCWTIRPI